MTEPMYGLGIAAAGALVLFWPGLLYLRGGRNWFRPLSDTEKLVARIFGGGAILVGLALALTYA